MKSKEDKEAPDALDIAIQKSNAMTDEERAAAKQGDDRFQKKMQSSVPDKESIQPQ